MWHSEPHELFWQLHDIVENELWSPIGFSLGNFSWEHRLVSSYGWSFVCGNDTGIFVLFFDYFTVFKHYPDHIRKWFIVLLWLDIFHTTFCSIYQAILYRYVCYYVILMVYSNGYVCRQPISLLLWVFGVEYLPIICKKCGKISFSSKKWILELIKTLSCDHSKYLSWCVECVSVVRKLNFLSAILRNIPKCYVFTPFCHNTHVNWLKPCHSATLNHLL